MQVYQKPRYAGKRGRRQPGRKSGAAAVAIALALTGLGSPGLATVSTDTAATDSVLYAQGKSSYRKRCARCHGVNMANPGVGIYDLRLFPKDERARFIDSVTHGKNAMPSWQDVLGPEDIEALWIYVSTDSSSTAP